MVLTAVPLVRTPILGLYMAERVRPFTRSRAFQCKLSIAFVLFGVAGATFFQQCISEVTAVIIDVFIGGAGKKGWIWGTGCIQIGEDAWITNAGRKDIALTESRFCFRMQRSSRYSGCN